MARYATCRESLLQADPSLGTPALAGVPENRTLSALDAIAADKTGQMNTMRNIARLLTPTRREAVAAFLARVKPANRHHDPATAKTERLRSKKISGGFAMSEASGWRLVARSAMSFVAAFLLAGCHKSWRLYSQDFTVNKAYPPLKFDLMDAETGKAVTQADFLGRIVMLYFGYPNCPYVCPLTLSDTVWIFHMIGKDARDLRFLFVAVDPRCKTLPVVNKYIALYGSKDILGLRGSTAELYDLATRYHAGYSVHPSPDPTKYTVTHSAAITVFNREGKAEFIVTGLASQHPDLKGIARDLNYLAENDAI